MKKKKGIFGNKSSLSNKNQKKKNIGENDILKNYDRKVLSLILFPSY